MGKASEGRLPSNFASRTVQEKMGEYDERPSRQAQQAHAAEKMTQGLPQPPVFSTLAEERQYHQRAPRSRLQLFAKFRFDEGVAGHITARDPEFADTFWVNGFAGRALARSRRQILSVSTTRVELSKVIIPSTLRLSRFMRAFMRRVPIPSERRIRIPHTARRSRHWAGSWGRSRKTPAPP